MMISDRRTMMNSDRVAMGQLSSRITELRERIEKLEATQGQGDSMRVIGPGLVQGDVHVDNEILGRDEMLGLLKEAYSYIDRRSQALDVNHEDYSETLNLEIRLRDFLQNGGQGQQRDNVAQGEQKLSYEELESRLEAMYVLVGQKRSVDLDDVIAIIENEIATIEPEGEWGCYEAEKIALRKLIDALNRTYEARSGPGPKQDR